MPAAPSLQPPPGLATQTPPNAPAHADANTGTPTTPQQPPHATQTAARKAEDATTAPAVPRPNSKASIDVNKEEKPASTTATKPDAKPAQETAHADAAPPNHTAADTDTAPADDDTANEDDDDHDDTPQKRTEADAGHGSQRVANKNGKWEWKQWNRKHGGQRPDPQQQEGPGWGFLYQQRNYPAGAAPPFNTNAIPTGDKAANFERDRALFRDLLNNADRPWQPQDTTTPGRTAPQQHTHQQDNVEQTTATAADQPTPTTEPKPQPSRASADVPTAHANQHPPAHDNQEPDPDRPPPVPHSHECEVTYYDLTHGCHSIHVTLLDSATSRSSSSHSRGKLPHIIITGDTGLLATAPPFPEGTTRTFAPMATNMWLLVLTYVPDPPSHTPGALLLAEGDKLLFEYTRQGWIIRMEATSEIASPSILALRATKETSRRQQHQQHEATRGPRSQPSQQARDAASSHSASSSSHEKPRSYYPTPTLPQKPDTTVGSTDTTHGDTRQPPSATTHRNATHPAFVDTRRLREHQPDRLPQPQAQSSHNHARPSPTLATKLQDGRRIGPAPAPPAKENSPTPTPPPDHSDSLNDATNLMQQPHSIAKTLTQPTDTATASESPHTKDGQPTPPPPTEHSTMPPPPQSPRGSNHATIPLPGNTEAPPLPTSPPPRSWQRVETQLEEIRRLAEHQAHQPIATAAETALIELLVDSQTAAAVEAWDDGFPTTPPGQPNPTEPSAECLPSTKRARNSHSINRDAAAAARYLTALGHGQLSAHIRPLTYNSVEPQIAVLMQWLGTLTSDVEVHLQLPPTLAALRGILNNILDQQTNPNTWATMIEVGEALEQLVQGNRWRTPPTLCACKTGDTTPTSWSTTRIKARGVTSSRLPRPSSTTSTTCQRTCCQQLKKQRYAWFVALQQEPQQGGKAPRRGTQRHGGNSTDTTGSGTTTPRRHNRDPRQAE